MSTYEVLDEINPVRRWSPKAEANDTSPHVPERALWVVVFITALKDLHSKEGKEDAREWFLSDDTEPGSCRWICQALGLSYPLVCAILNDDDKIAHIIKELTC